MLVERLGSPAGGMNPGLGAGMGMAASPRLPGGNALQLRDQGGMDHQASKNLMDILGKAPTARGFIAQPQGTLCLLVACLCRAEDLGDTCETPLGHGTAPTGLQEADGHPGQGAGCAWLHCAAPSLLCSCMFEHILTCKIICASTSSSSSRPPESTLKSKDRFWARRQVRMA